VRSTQHATQERSCTYAVQHHCLLHQNQSKVHMNEKGLYKCRMFTASSIRTDVSIRIDVSAYTNSCQRV